MVGKLVPGHSYVMAVSLALARWCVCDTTLPAGAEVRVERFTSPNRVEILYRQGLHKARASTLRMAVDEKEA